MQCGSMYRAEGDPKFAPVGETEFVNGVAAMSASDLYGPAGLCAGIVGFADLSLGAAVDAVLEAHLRAAGERFKGVRRPCQAASLFFGFKDLEAVRLESLASIATLSQQGFRKGEPTS